MAWGRWTKMLMMRFPATPGLSLAASHVRANALPELPAETFWRVIPSSGSLSSYWILTAGATNGSSSWTCAVPPAGIGTGTALRILGVIRAAPCPVMLTRSS